MGSQRRRRKTKIEGGPANTEGSQAEGDEGRGGHWDSFVPVRGGGEEIEGGPEGEKGRGGTETALYQSEEEDEKKLKVDRQRERERERAAKQKEKKAEQDT